MLDKTKARPVDKAKLIRTKQKQAEEVLKLIHSEYGSEKCCEAQNSYVAGAMTTYMTPEVRIQFDEFCNKATSDEIVIEAFRLACIHIRENM